MIVRNPDFAGNVAAPHKDAAAVVAFVKASGKGLVTFVELLAQFPYCTHGELHQILNNAGMVVEL